MAKENGNSKAAKKELVLDILATTLMDAFVLVGIISMIPHREENPGGTIAAMVSFAVLGALYTEVVGGEDRKKLKQR